MTQIHKDDWLIFEMANINEGHAAGDQDIKDDIIASIQTIHSKQDKNVQKI